QLLLLLNLELRQLCLLRAVAQGDLDVEADKPVRESLRKEGFVRVANPSDKIRRDPGLAVRIKRLRPGDPDGSYRSHEVDLPLFQILLEPIVDVGLLDARTDLLDL